MPRKKQTKPVLIGRYQQLGGCATVSIYLFAEPYRKPIIIKVTGDEAEIVDTNLVQGVSCTSEVKLVRQLLHDHEKHGITHSPAGSPDGSVEVGTMPTVLCFAHYDLEGMQVAGIDGGD